VSLPTEEKQLRIALRTASRSLAFEVVFVTVLVFCIRLPAAFFRVSHKTEVNKLLWLI